MKLSEVIKELSLVLKEQGGDLDVYVHGKHIGWTDRFKTVLDKDSIGNKILLIKEDKE